MCNSLELVSYQYGMKFEDLKLLWRTSMNTGKLDNKEIRAMIHGTSRSIVYKLKRNLCIEAVLTFVAGVAIAFFIPQSENKGLNLLLTSLLFISITFSILFIKKIIQLNSFNPAIGNVRENLLSLITTLEFFLRFYKRSYTVLFPFYFILAIVLIAFDIGYSNFIEKFLKPEIGLKITGIVVLLIWTSTLISNWFLKNCMESILIDLRCY